MVSMANAYFAMFTARVRLLHARGRQLTADRPVGPDLGPFGIGNEAGDLILHVTGAMYPVEPGDQLRNSDEGSSRGKVYN